MLTNMTQSFPELQESYDLSLEQVNWTGAYGPAPFPETSI